MEKGRKGKMEGWRKEGQRCKSERREEAWEGWLKGRVQRGSESKSGRERWREMYGGKESKRRWMVKVKEIWSVEE